MHVPARAAIGGALLLLLAGTAQAASVTCQSRNNQREECWLRGRGEVVLVRQISNTKCVKGRNWDETRNGLYVTDGCGGVFETRDGWNDGRPGQGGGWGGGNGGGNGGGWGGGAGGGWQDLIGSRASGGEQELRRRGYRDTRSESAPGGRFVFWRTPQRGCIEVRVADGRFQTIRAVHHDQCDGGRPQPPDRPMPGGGRPTGAPPADMCMMQNINEGNAPGDGRIERQAEIRPGVWEFTIGFSNGRFVCRVDSRGRVMSFNRG